MSTHKTFAAIWAACVLALPPLTYAQSEYDTTIVRGKATTEQLIDALTPDPPGNDGEVLTRGLKVKKKAEGTKPKAKAIALKINFEFGSYDLTSDARETLSSLAGAMSSPELAAFNFLIEGHTDSVGSASFNRTLSERRAGAVKQYLSNELSVSAGRLQTVGRGEEALLLPAQPTSGENRRVQIVTLQ